MFEILGIIFVLIVGILAWRILGSTELDSREIGRNRYWEDPDFDSESYWDQEKKSDNRDDNT